MRLSKLSTILVTLPLLALPLSAMAVRPAMAAGNAAAEALRILAKAQAADAHCNYLSSSEKSELSGYAMRAERAATRQGATAAARDAARAGVADAKAASCAPELEADVRDTLQAAREAAVASKARDAQPGSQPVAAEPTPEPHAVPADVAVQPMKGGRLGRYAEVVRAYYLERECRSLPRADADRFYQAVVDLHRRTLNPGSRSAMARAMADAERQARQASCGGRVLAEIERGYQEVSSR